MILNPVPYRNSEIQPAGRAVISALHGSADVFVTGPSLHYIIHRITQVSVHPLISYWLRLLGHLQALTMSSPGCSISGSLYFHLKQTKNTDPLHFPALLNASLLSDLLNFVTNSALCGQFYRTPSVWVTKPADRKLLWFFSRCLTSPLTLAYIGNVGLVLWNRPSFP